MNATRIAGIALALLLAGGAGYWAGRLGPSTTAAEAGTASAPVAAGRKLLYYRNPMGLPDTSPVPKKDPMGMDYLPVYEGEAAGGGEHGLRVSAEKVQKSGVKTEAVTRRNLDRLLRASGRVEFDERRVVAVAPKFEGWIERLHVNVTGQAVAKGQPLFEAYSPELVSAQREYALAMRGTQSASGETRAAMRQLAEASLARLRNWDISDEQLQALAAGGEVKRTLTYRAPAGGVVTEKKALPGLRFMPGETLYQLADTDQVWVIAEVPEQDIGRVRKGARGWVEVEAYPGRRLEGTVSYVYPAVKAETRTVPVRLELANPGGWLKPAMYARVELPSGPQAPVLAVPNAAVIDSGTRRVAMVEVEPGRFEARELRTGMRGDAYVEVLDGLKEGERVVVAGNFLLDSESNLKAALSGLEKAKPGVAHRADGTLDAIDAQAGTVTVSHEPVASLNWPKMTMEFVPARPDLLAGLKPGTAIRFEFVERKPGEWVITRADRKAP